MTTPTPQQQDDSFEQAAARAGAAARYSTERLPVTTAALHHHRQQRNTRRGIAMAALAVAGATAVTMVVLNRPIDTADVSPAEPVPSVSASLPSWEVAPRALESVGVKVAAPYGWTLMQDSPQVATFELALPDGYKVTAMAFVPGSVVNTDGTRGPVPQALEGDGPAQGEDVGAWATRTDITLGGTGGIPDDVGLYRGRYLEYQATADSLPLMCPEPPSATTCSVPAPGADTYAELNTFHDDAGRIWAIIFYKDPQSPGPPEDIQTGELIASFQPIS